ncbi:hypothetical protein RDWZM_003931 [Blomia tropicalis]|uniref:DNA topoisomerase n=1 Tax=Blomia tropicalis TaxID=40697 RepID=A0A9Q0RTH1_BLOTA|nr:hypothetical protein RDWZM_003931 [Blomia tropicalis]
MSRKISVLMIAEKPALAKTLSTILSNGQMQCRKTRVCNVYEYKGSFLQHEEVQFKFTSVLGHVFEIEFDHREKWNNPPINMYDANVIKLESRPDIKMVDFLKREAKGCKYLVLWLDCDKEGENICFEIIDSLNDVMTISMSNPQTVFRAHFSAITSTDINEAFRNLRLPNRLKSLSVTARQELDLKIGCSFTRFQNSFFHRKYSGLRNMLISYGQCQIPTLAFCVNRYDEIQAFKPTSYWTLSAKIASFNQPKQLINVDCTYEREFNCNNIKLIYNYLKNIGEGKVVSVVKSKRTTFKPKALNTVEMLKIASSKLGISPHQTMQIAEKLYNDGFISYPRTETTQYPKNFDLIRILQMLCRSNKWGMLAQDIIDNGIIPPRPGHDAGDHPPITPMKVSNNNQPLMGDSWRLYEYIVQHFLATLALDMVHESTSIEIDINSKIFKTNFSYVSIYGFANYLPKTLSSLVQQNPPLLNVNDKVMVSKIMIKKHTTKSPGFLTESELISLMEKNGIGTDASIPNHINNICLRKYVNISTGRTLVPTKLGIILIRGYMKIDQELVMPTIRSKLESELNLIATGDADFETVLKKNIEYHRTKFIWFIRNIKQMDELFESSYETLLNELAQNSSNEKKNDSLSKIKEKGKGKVKGNEKGKGKIKGKGNIKGKKKKEKPKQRKSCLKKTLNRNQDLSTLSDQNRENAKKGKKKNGRQVKKVIDDNGNGNETVSIKAIDEPKQTEIESNNRTHSLSVWTTIFHFLKPDLSAILAAYFNIKINLALGDLMNAIQNCLQSSSLANLSGSVFFSRFTELVKNPALNLFSIYMFQSLFTFVYLYSLFVLAEKTANRIRYELFSKFLSFELTFFDVNNGGNILSSLSNDVQDFKSSFKQLISLGIKNFAQIVGSVVTLYHISPKMTLIINLGIIPTMAIIGSQVGSRLRKLSKRLQNQLGNITNVAFESINNIRTVKMLGIEEILLGKFLTELRAFDRINQSFSTGFAMFQSLSNFAFNGIILITLLFGGYNLLSGEMSAGSLMSFLATTQTIQRSLFQLSLLYGHYFKVTSSMNRILDYLVIESPQINGTIIPNLIGNIEFKDVIFRYPKRPDYTVLKNINLKLDPGKVTALCGPSGSGKSTIAMLLESLYDLESGTISVDNVEIDQLDRRWLRNVAIGYISQEPVLFATTIKENIKYGKMDATDEEIERAARFANAHDFISNFPDGYDTVVGHQGAALSGGQRQRIAIARALIKDPKILILDEATSALDTESESLVKDALDKLMEGRTVLVIAHRLSTILDSDRIVVLDDGHILEHGTHGQLLKLKGKYYELVKKSLDNGSNEPNKLN